jgi:hypothetical protein
MRYSLARVLGLVILCIAATPAVRATCGEGGGGMTPTGGTSEPVYFVPWKVLNPGEVPVQGNLILYWLPATRDEIKRSELLSSRQLTIFASQCVGMQVVRPDDAAMIEKLGESGKLPAVVLADNSGKLVSKLDSDNGGIRLSAVEKMVRDELGTREATLEKLLDEANARKGTGEKELAIDLYKKVWEQRCLFPRKARDAQKALKKLGVVVQDAQLRTVSGRASSPGGSECRDSQSRFKTDGGSSNLPCMVGHRSPPVHSLLLGRFGELGGELLDDPVAEDVGHGQDVLDHVVVVFDVCRVVALQSVRRLVERLLEMHVHG